MNTRNCASCGKEFHPRNSQILKGHGHYCSQRCNFEGQGRALLLSKENLDKAAQARRVSVAIKGTKHKSGAESPCWKGGAEAYKARKVIKDVAYTREYRKRNPEMMREARAKRRGLGRLPRGTIKRIGEAQRWRCAVCSVCITGCYHMDHINPISKGGEHVPGNIQLLCPSCNLRKNAKDPIKFMQERGFLL
jgi:5-methylcytosine-specific restriction endonuclease McrA